MDDECLVLIVGACVVIIPDGERLEVYSDLVNSILLAQLVANKKREKSLSPDWYGTYVSVLDDFWLRHQKSKQTWQVSNPGSQSALEFFNTALSNDAMSETRIMGAVLQRMAQIPGDELGIQRLRSFMKISATAESDSMPPPLAKVHLLVIVANAADSIASAFVEFEASLELSQNPFHQLYQCEEVQGLVHVHHSRASLSEIRYSGAREAIARKVRDKLADSVAVLNLPKEITA
jgi:hypothetical protein